MPNRVRFDGNSRRYYEVWYTIFNEPASGDGYWIRYTLLNPLEDHPEAGAALWFGYTCRADPQRSLTIRKSFPKGSFEAVRGSSTLRIGDATLDETSFIGAFSADGHEVRWALHYEPSEQPHYYFGKALRRIAERRNSVTVPNPRISLDGDVSIDGRTSSIRNGIGHQAHHWGTQRARRWNWGHCCAFEGDEAVLELLSGEAPGGLTPTFVNLHTPEESYLCQDLAGLLRNRCVSGLGFWRFEGHTRGRTVIADVHVDPRFVQRFVYVSPTYRTSECWNTQVGDCLVRIYEGPAPTGRLVRSLRARGTAAAEIHDEEPARIPYPRWRSENQ